jgi:hypothetical protein
MAKKRSDKDYEQLGRMLENIYESGYIDRNQAYKTSFIKGLLSGVGGVLGATILIALLLWILTLFKQVPLVGPFFDRVRTTVQSERQ